MITSKDKNSIQIVKDLRSHIKNKGSLIYSDDDDLIETEKTYQDSFVAYFDILGMQKEVEKKENKPAEVIDAMITFAKVVKKHCDAKIGERFYKHIQMSDSFVLKVEQEYFCNLIIALACIQWEFLYTKNKLLRGAITFGKIHVIDESNQFVGPALVRAFQLESEQTYYPRFLLDRDNIKISGYDLPEGIISYDSDKEAYINFLYNLDADKKKAIKKDVNYKKLCSFIKKEYENNIKSKISQKYAWLVDVLESNHLCSKGEIL